MINISKLQATLSSTNFKKMSLPNDKSDYYQRTYTELRGNSERFNEEIKQQEEIKKTIESGIEVNVINTNNIQNFDNLIKKEDKKNYKIKQVKYSSYINYTENTTFDLPEDLQEVLNDEINETTKLYGLKNPNSFVKAIILLSDSKYMVFNNYQMKQAVYKYKTEMSYYFKNNKATFNNLPRNDLTNIESLILRENFHNNLVGQIASLMKNFNLYIIDYINRQYYSYINFDDNKECHIIIKYQDCYLPLLRVNTKNLFTVKNIKNLLFAINYNLANEKYLQQKSAKIDNNSIEDVDNSETVMLSSLIDIKKFKRDDLQRIAISYEIDIMKSGKNGKIKKTKQELYNDFKMVVYDSNKLNSKDF